jgi:hypothetical protein
MPDICFAHWPRGLDMLWLPAGVIFSNLVFDFFEMRRE